MTEDLENVDRPDEEVTGRRLSRRTMIAGTAGAAAVMWAAPAVTSLAPRAFAQSPVCGNGTQHPFCPTIAGCGPIGFICLCATDLSGDLPVCVLPPFGVPCPNDDACQFLGPGAKCISYQPAFSSCLSLAPPGPGLGYCSPACPG